MKSIGLLLVSTGNLATSLQKLTENLMGKQAHLKAVVLKREDHWKEAAEKVRRAAVRVDQGRGVLVLTDVAGGTPFNVSMSLREELPIEVLGGVNVPMVLKAIQVANIQELKKAAVYLKHYGQEHIIRGNKRG